MNEPILSIFGSAQQLSNHKRMVVGTPISDPIAIREAYEKSFEALVTAAYRWYGEAIRQDRVFLEGSASRSDQGKLRRFLRLLQDQRHDKEHHGYEREADAQTWREQAVAAAAPGTERDVRLREAMVAELQTALQILCVVALHVRADARSAQSWREHAAVTPKAEILNVYSTLGLRPPHNLGYIVRQYENDPDLRSARTPEARAQVAQASAIGIGLVPLSIAYDELLDEFGLVGDPLGRSLLVLAHGVEASGHSAASTLAILKSVWPIVCGTA